MKVYHFENCPILSFLQLLRYSFFIWYDLPLVYIELVIKMMQKRIKKKRYDLSFHLINSPRNQGL